MDGLAVLAAAAAEAHTDSLPPTRTHIPGAARESFWLVTTGRGAEGGGFRENDRREKEAARARYGPKTSKTCGRRPRVPPLPTASTISI